MLRECDKIDIRMRILKVRTTFVKSYSPRALALARARESYYRGGLRSLPRFHDGGRMHKFKLPRANCSTTHYAYFITPALRRVTAIFSIVDKLECPYDHATSALSCAIDERELFVRRAALPVFKSPLTSR